MPIYEYQCQACGHHFDRIQKFSDEPVKECPSCHKIEVKKLISAPSFHLKGTGWYVTDFKDSGKPKATETKAEEKAADTTKDSDNDSKKEVTKDSTPKSSTDQS